MSVFEGETKSNQEQAEGNRRHENKVNWQRKREKNYQVFDICLGVLFLLCWTAVLAEVSYEFGSAYTGVCPSIHPFVAKISEMTH